MRWQVKAAIQGVSSVLPRGDDIYQSIQTRFGNLNVRPMARLPYQVQMSEWLRDSGGAIDGTYFEVGTGHLPVLPVGFYLCGARKVYTADLYRRLRPDLTADLLGWLSTHREDYLALLPEDLRMVAKERLDTVTRFRDDPLAFMKAANIEYLAPCDAASAPLDDGAIDVHVSCNVFEHIPLPVLGGIMVEAHRILGDDGKAVHFIDPSDHFQHGDRSITKINFLHYRDPAWRMIAGNRFAYSSRARVTDYRKLFDAAGFAVEREERDVDAESLRALEQGFKVAPPYSGLPREVLATTYYKALLTPQQV